MGFQSRLGRTPWIQPYTDDLLVELVNGGVKRLLVTCPSFVSDCLETLEEIGIRAKKDFIAAGGEDLKIVPCLNSDPDWIQAVASMVRSQAPSA
jgi:ferrochelatase